MRSSVSPWEVARDHGWDPTEQATIIQVQGKLSMGAMGSESTMEEMRDQHDKWQAVVDKLNSEAEFRGLPHLAKAFVTSVPFAFMQMSENFVSSFWLALCVSLACALCTLLVGIGNWYLAVTTTISVLLIVLQVLGFIIICCLSQN